MSGEKREAKNGKGAEEDNFRVRRAGSDVQDQISQEDNEESKSQDSRAGRSEMVRK